AALEGLPRAHGPAVPLPGAERVAHLSVAAASDDERRARTAAEPDGLPGAVLAGAHADRHVIVTSVRAAAARGVALTHPAAHAVDARKPLRAGLLEVGRGERVHRGDAGLADVLPPGGIAVVRAVAELVAGDAMRKARSVGVELGARVDPLARAFALGGAARERPA